MTYSRADLLAAAQAAGPSALLVVTRVLLAIDRQRPKLAATKSDADEVLARKVG